MTRQEGDLGLIAACAARGGLVAMDVQGFTREVVDGAVRPAPPAERLDQLRQLDVLKADDAEILAYSGAADVAAAAAKVGGGRACARPSSPTPAAARPSSGPVGRLEIRALPPRRHVDPTGCGDTYLAAYMTRRLSSDDLRDCGDFAAAAAALKIEQVGPLRGTRRGDRGAARRAARLSAQAAPAGSAGPGRAGRRRSRARRRVTT